MSIRTKLTSLITTFVLLCSLLTVGVFAVKNTTFNVGGDIVFNVQGIEATITRGDCEGFVTTNDKVIGDAAGNILSNVTLNNEMTADQVSSAFAPWTNLELAFEEGATTASIELTITNTVTGVNPDNYLEIKATSSVSDSVNAEINVKNENNNRVALLSQNQSVTFTITFKVIDEEYSASLRGFSVNFDIQKKVASDYPSYDAVENMEFECDTNNGIATLTDGSSTSGEVVIPAYVRDGNVVCAVDCIWMGAFYDNEDITSITFADTNIYIEDDAFCSCDNLVNINWSDSIRYIGSSAFAHTGLTSVVIPDSVTDYIGESAFSYCENLVEFSIGDQVKEVYGGIVSGENFYAEIDGGKYLLDRNGNPTYLIGFTTDFEYDEDSGEVINKLETFKISDRCKVIGVGLFDLYENAIETLIIPKSVKVIGEWAFTASYAVSTINYMGSEEDWAKIEIGMDNVFDNITINFNYVG